MPETPIPCARCDKPAVLNVTVPGNVVKADGTTLYGHGRLPLCRGCLKQLAAGQAPWLVPTVRSVKVTKPA